VHVRADVVSGPMTTSKLDVLVSGPIGAFSVAPSPAIASP
jgi:hypothetical protein